MSSLFLPITPTERTDAPLTAALVFLDIDGVMNSAQFLKTLPPEKNAVPWIDPAAVARLNQITAMELPEGNTWETGVGIVISSTRRYTVDWITLLVTLRDAGVQAPILGSTPIIPSDTRGAEIITWLHKYAPNTPYVVLDDEVDARRCGVGDRAVFTSYSSGLRDSHVGRAIQVVERQIRRS